MIHMCNGRGPSTEGLFLQDACHAPPEDAVLAAGTMTRSAASSTLEVQVCFIRTLYASNMSADSFCIINVIHNRYSIFFIVFF